MHRTFEKVINGFEMAFAVVGVLRRADFWQLIALEAEVICFSHFLNFEHGLIH